MNRDNALFYTCSLLEFIGRTQQLSRGDVVNALGENMVRRVYNHADVFHCEPIEKVADDLIERCGIPKGTYDNVKECKYHVPDYWTMGDVYTRLIEDVSENNVIEMLIKVYTSWISEKIDDYNTDLYFQPRDYIKECYLQNEILDD